TIKNLFNEIASGNYRVTNVKQEIDKPGIFLNTERQTGKVALEQNIRNASNQVRDTGKNVTNGQDAINERVILFPAESVTQSAGKIALEEQGLKPVPSVGNPARKGFKLFLNPIQRTRNSVDQALPNLLTQLGLSEEVGQSASNQRDRTNPRVNEPDGFHKDSGDLRQDWHNFPERAKELAYNPA